MVHVAESIIEGLSKLGEKAWASVIPAQEKATQKGLSRIPHDGLSLGPSGFIMTAPFPLAH